MHFVERLRGYKLVLHSQQMCPEFRLRVFQVLVLHDMLGINKEFNPRFLRRYADLHTVVSDAVAGYVRDVRAKDFPSPKEQY